jgi:hypothetical protein
MNEVNMSRDECAEYLASARYTWEYDAGGGKVDTYTVALCSMHADEESVNLENVEVTPLSPFAEVSCAHCEDAYGYTESDKYADWLERTAWAEEDE